MKFISIVLLSLALAGCGATAGTYTKTPLLNPDGTVVTNILGMPVYSRTRASQHVAIANAASEAFKGRNSAPEPSCSYLDAAAITGLGDTAQRAYFESVSECERSRGTARLVASALGRPTTASGEVVQGYSSIVASVEQGKTARFSSGVRAITSLGTAGLVAGAVKSAFEANRDVGIAAAENAGDVDVGSLIVDNSQSVSNSSNDASAGEGSASSSITSTLTNEAETNITIGRGNRAFVNDLSDTSRLNIADENIQALEPSATGTLQTDGVKNNGFVNTDDNTGATNEAQDDDGLNI